MFRRWLTKLRYKESRFADMSQLVASTKLIKAARTVRESPRVLERLGVQYLLPGQHPLHQGPHPQLARDGSFNSPISCCLPANTPPARLSKA